MKPQPQKKWYIKDITPSTTKRQGFSSSPFVPDLQHSSDLQAASSSRTNKKKTVSSNSYKQTRPPSAEIAQRQTVISSPLSLSSKLRSNKPTVYNLVTQGKGKVKPTSTFSSTQKSFGSTFGKTIVKVKSLNGNENMTEVAVKMRNQNETGYESAKIDRVEQASKSTQCFNESSKSLQQLNETSMTIKAENPDNSVKNVPLVSPINNMMRRLTLNEQNPSSESKSSGLRVNNGKESLENSSQKTQIRSFSQNNRSVPISVNPHTKNQTEFNSPKKTDNPLQKITNLVKEINNLENKGNYDAMREYVAQLEEKITDLKSSIELSRPKKQACIFLSGENKENKVICTVANETNTVNLKNVVTSWTKPLSKGGFKPNNEKPKSGNVGINNTNVVAMTPNIGVCINLKRQYPKSTTNADLQRKKFEFQNKPTTVKIQTINPQEELIPEEPQANCEYQQDPFTLMTELKQKPALGSYYISNAVNSFYRPLGVYEDSCEDNYFTQLCQEHFMQTFQSLHLAQNLFNNPENHSFEEKKIELERRDSHKNKKTIIFDLDETLVHCNESLELPADIVVPITFPNGQKIEAGINIRPHTLECLEALSPHFEIIVFTASHSCYANVVLDYLDPDNTLIHHRMYREHCISTKEGVFIKDLRVIGNRKLSDMLIVDNAAYSFAFQLENGIPILPFYDFKADQELLRLKEYLLAMESLEGSDLREINAKTFRFSEFGKYEDVHELIEKELGL